MTIGKKLRQCRLEAGLSQKELGEKLNVSQAMIAQYENGKLTPKLYTLEKISNALNIETSELIDFDTMQDNYFEESWFNLEDSRLSYFKYMGYEIVPPKDGDNFFTIYHNGYEYTIPYCEPSVHYDVICEVVDSYVEYTLDRFLTQYATHKKKI